VELGPDDVLVLCSDGVGPAMTQLPADFAQALRRAVAEPFSAARFATLLDFDITGHNYDDRTLMAVLPRVPGV
jgi:hypothetical protein